MNSFNGITLGILAGSLLFAGCKGVSNWAEKEHELKPLKEQYFNGELSWSEYRQKKRVLVEDIERRQYRATMDERREALRAAQDSHTVSHVEEAQLEKIMDEETLAADNQMLKEDLESPAPAPAKPAASSSIDYGLLSRSIKSKDSSTAAAASTPTIASGEELITDSKDIKWTKDKDGVVTYEDPKGAAMVEQVIKDAQSESPPPEIVTVPVGDPVKEGDAETVDVKIDEPPTPDATAEKVQQKVEEVKEEAEEPAHKEEEPAIMDFGTIE
ncbi:hypothetical protein [Cerasicoccus frondis]|uniref:hypothetical protein n=1 Tax=Cerasicoccus frondis TaxID=490090 RepID=UPI0028526871|nr:hypothetical protein [Cerasicoccus frondis]